MAYEITGMDVLENPIEPSELDSILLSVKKCLGLNPEQTEFDTDIIIAINSAILVLTQMGIGPTEGFLITGPTETYTEFVGESARMEAVKSYLYYKAKLGFDSPSSATVTTCLKEMISELEWRLRAEVDPPNIFE